jgi:O-antigen/teichoic acid export membrane protein
MFFTAPLLATAVLKAPQLEILLRWAALSTGLAIMVACFRGLFIGEGNFKSLLAVCSIAALGLAVLLPLAAYIGLVAMIKAQIAASMPAVAISAIIVWRLVRRSRGNSAIGDDGPKLSTIAGFGLAQLGATAGISVASWWVSVLLIRNDSSFRQMGFYAISNQVRGLLAIGPTIVGQIIYSALTKEGGKKFGGPQRVTAAATYFNTVLVLVLLMCLLPTITRLIALFYGTRYSGCELVVTLSLATVIVHMCGVPAALRLSVVSISTLTALNVVWTIAVAVLAYTLIPSYGAAGAAGAYLIAHTCSQLFAAVGLWRTGEANADFLKLSILIAGTAIGIGAIACIQYAHPHLTVALHVASVLLPGVVIATIMRRADVRACLSFARFDYARSSVS